MKKVGVVILAAGEGKRMKSAIAKVMHELRGKPLIEYVVRAVEAASFGKPVVVISREANEVAAYLGERATYAVQKEKLGTAHAVGCAKDALKDFENVIVLHGDMPFVRGSTLNKILDEHIASKAPLSMTVSIVKSFEGWEKQLYDFGRIVRRNGLVKIVERKDATPDELDIHEVNTGYFCFTAEWLWNNLPKVKNANAQNEYYVTDLVSLATNQMENVNTIIIDAKQAIGINTPEQLKAAHNI